MALSITVEYLDIQQILYFARTTNSLKIRLN